MGTKKRPLDKKSDEPQIRSKERVAGYGEVFTSSPVVKAMCDLVESETERIDSRFLEPACGHGNFLEEILKRKLNIVKKMYRKDPYYFELYAFVAASGLYGIDIMEDNVEECRKRLLGVWEKSYAAAMRSMNSDEDESVKKAVSYIFNKNIICGDALTLKIKDKSPIIDGDALTLQAESTPIIFSEWSVIDRTKRLIKRRDFELSELMAQDAPKRHRNQKSLAGFGSADEESFRIPEPVKLCEYDAVDFRRVTEYA